MTLFCSFLSLDTILTAVACTQFQNMIDLLEMRQQHITSYHVQEDEQDHATVKCKLQAKIKRVHSTPSGNNGVSS